MQLLKRQTAERKEEVGDVVGNAEQGVMHFAVWDTGIGIS